MISQRPPDEPVDGVAGGEDIAESSGIHQRIMFWHRWRYDPEPEVAANVERELFHEGERRRPYLFRFFILLVLSTFIASFGLLTNSTAVVIAAMIVAPLMTPILGFAAGMVTGRPRRQGESALLVLVATIVIILQAIFIVVLTANPATIPREIMNRTSPQILDLGIAIAAGSAGAYSIVRREASSALAGVAIGVSLVPPLASFGLLLAWSEHDFAWGALLLYVTNLAAIVFSGAVVFSIMGFLPVSALGQLSRRIRLGLIVAALSIVIVAVPLYNHTRTVVRRGSTEQTVARVINEALRDTEFELFAFEQDGEHVTVSIVGPTNLLDNPPPDNNAVALAAAQLAEELGRRIELEVRIFPYTEFETVATPVSTSESGE